MKLKFPQILLITFFSSIFCASLEMIPSISVKYGTKKGIDLGNYRIKNDDVFRVQKIDGFDFWVAGDSLYVTAQPSAKGIHPVNLSLGDEKFTLILKVLPSIEVDFIYPGDKGAKSVHVMGYFNDWSRTSDGLSIEKDGNWHLKQYFEPGTYEYKFVVDGSEPLDPANPDSVSNGIGGFNSVMTIGSELLKASGMFVKESYTQDGDSLKMTFNFVSSTTSENISEENIHIMFENHLLDSDMWKFDSDVLTIFGPAKGKSGMLRIFAENDDGIVTRENQTLIKSGQPITPQYYPNDWHFSVIYSIIVDRFFDGDLSNNRPVQDDEIHPLASFQGGDISGIHKKLEDGYFSDLGINTLWISPIIQNAEGGYTEFIPPHRKFTGYHGYWPTHPRNVDDRFTTKEELISFISTAHEQDMKILMDFVSNHTHENHPYFKDHRDWYGQVELPDGTMNIRNWSGETMLTTWFDTFLPSFDYVSNPDAIDQVVSDAVFWLGEYKFDGFRQDATKHVPHSFWKELTKQVKYNFTEREIFQIGESFGSNDLIGEYVNPGELNSQFNFELYFEGRWQFSGHPDFVKLNRTVSSNMDFFQPMNTMGTITSSHDQVRFMGFADGQLNFEENGTERGFSNPPISVKNSSSYDKLFMFTVFNMCLPGIPVVYYGEEIGQIGANDPDNRRMMRFDDQLTTDEQIHFQKMSQLIKLRRNFPALSIGDLVVIYEDKNLSCWLKIYFEERVLVIFNNSSNTQEVTLDFSTEIHRAVSLLDRSFVDVESGIFMTNVDAYETKLYQLMK